MQVPNTKETKSIARLARDRARKRQERAAFRRASLVEIRLHATVGQRQRLFEVLEREKLTLLRHPGLLAASLHARPKRGRRATKLAPVASATQLDLFGLPLVDASEGRQPTPTLRTRPGGAIGATESVEPRAGGPSVPPAVDSTRSERP